MKLTWSAVAAAFAAVSVVNAHFEISFPQVRGPFDDDNEPQFCGQCSLGGYGLLEQEFDTSGRTDGYTDPANRTPFPLTSGFIVWNGSHPSWTSELYFLSLPQPQQ